MSDKKSILCEFNNGVAFVTLNRPDVLNSFNREMAVELQRVLVNIEKDLNIRAVLLTGSGRAFCSGQDLADVKPGADLGEIVNTHYNPIIRTIRRTEKPFICAVNGVAAGAGASIALACDIVLASSAASFIQSFSKIGLVPDSGATFILPRLVGHARAAAMTMLAEKIPAEQALQFGMIYKVLPAESLVAEATILATHLATQPTKGLGLTKRLLNASWANDLSTQLDKEEELQREAGFTADYREGVDAFMEKRAPVFKGK
jgi:2-(1,2-epoxy-1,2-dihydrophenyl)acetyl-CoA isomerase